MIKNLRSIFVATIAGAWLLCAASALANDAPGSRSTSSTSKLIEKLTASYAGYYYSAGLADLANPYQPDTAGQPDPGAPQMVENLLSLYYKVTPEISTGLRAHFLFTTVNSDYATMYDPLLQVNHSAIYKRGGFNLSGYARAYLPFTAESTSQNRILAMRFFLGPTYEIPNSRWTVGLSVYAQPQFFKSGTTKGTTLVTYIGPNVSYQLTPTVSINAVYESQAIHRMTDKDTFDLTSVLTDFEPGVSWDITPNINLNPYLNFYPIDGITMSNTTINLALSWKLM